ncbi:MAG: hypothetical protein J6334_05215 [Kiritimatiellae bacterium]|nr:hypothetical protein [Kiritimatiellia bacterium]
MTDTCEREVKRLIARVPEKDLNEILALDPAFQIGGFKAGKPELLRVRLTQVVCGQREVSSLVRSMLERRSRAKTLTGLLAPAALELAAPALAALLKPETLIVAGLLDPRKEVRDLAERWLAEGPDAFKPLSPEAATDQLRELFSDLHTLLGRSEQTGATLTPEAWRTQREALEQTIQSLKVEKQRLRGVDDRAAMYANQLKKAQAEIERLSTRLQTAEGDLHALRQKQAETAAELTRETANREERVKAAIDQALAHEFYGWLSAARQLERETAALPPADGDPLSQRVEAALKRQAETDRHSGNRLALAARLERLRAEAARVNDTLAHAIRQEPDLQAVARELADEIARLEGILGVASPDAAPLEAALLDQLNRAETNGLPLFKRQLELVIPLNLLPQAGIERIREAYRKRMAALAATGSDEFLAEPDTRSPEERLLGEALATPKPLILLLDGHNVLFGLPARYNPPRGQGRSDAEKRDRLAKDLARLVSASPAVRACIVFDGKSPTDTQAAPNVRVSYSGGEGEHRADKVLVDLIRFYRQSDPSTPVLLISDDRELCGNARRLGGQTLGVLTFGAFLPQPER